MKAIVLDMYGVVIRQTGDDFVPHVKKTFPEKSVEEIYTPWLRADIGEIPSLKIWELIGFTGDLARVEKEYLDTLELADGVLDFLEKAKKTYKLALLSNDSSEWSRYLRDKFGLEKYFETVCVSGDLKMAKPDPRMFLLAAERLGVQPADCVYVDDRRSNLNAAESLGMRPILMNSRHVAYNGETVLSFTALSETLGLSDS